MGLSQHHIWLFSCDYGPCPRLFNVRGGRKHEAKTTAQAAGWAQVAPWRGDSAWLCPRHAWCEDQIEHEQWCPYRTRNGPCACQDRPHGGSDALWGLDPRRRVTKVKVVGDIL